MAYNLIADIGGTNARFALVEKGSYIPREARTLICSHYATLVEATEAYLSTVPFAKPLNAVIALAAALTAKQVRMTNHCWYFDIDQVRRQLKMQTFKVINDFSALALAIPHLAEDKYQQIGSGEKQQQCTKALIGPGTGLGISAIIPCWHNNWIPLQGEGGHISYAPFNDLEAAIIKILKINKQPLSAESLLSGYGLSALYQALAQLKDVKTARLKASEISDKATQGTCAIAEEALAMFCVILGSVAANLALIFGARGGVYIGGGIVPKVLDYFAHSHFRMRFESHDKFSSYLQKIPSYVIIDKYATLVGAAFAFNKEYETLGISSSI